MGTEKEDREEKRVGFSPGQESSGLIVSFEEIILNVGAGIGEG